MDAEFGRFHIPEERPFSASLPPSRREVSVPDSMLALKDFNSVNLTAQILAAYMAFIPLFCPQGDDEQHGSSVEHDVFALQAISRRVHFGAMYVAEVKYRVDPPGYRALIAAEDREGIIDRLTRPEVESRILERVREKVAYIQARVNQTVRSLIDADVVLQFYRDTVIPLTKDGEILYLLHRTETGEGIQDRNA
jgi:chorismate mutase